MKKKSIFVAAMVVLMMASCSKDASDDVFNVQPSTSNVPVTLTFSPYEMEAMTRAGIPGDNAGGVHGEAEMTRAATSIASIVTHLDVWITDGTKTIDLHQTNSDADFGSLSVTLDKTKTYTLYAVGHKADGATLSDGVISFTDDKVTHAMYYSTTFSPATTTSLSCLMTRIVADFRLEITDDIPAECKSFRFTINSVYDMWSVTDGGTHSLDRVSTISYGGTSSIFNVYAIVTDAQTTHDITVEALDADDQPIQTRTFADVPLRNGYKTNYRGTFFIDTPMSISFTVNDWNEYETVDY